MVYKTVRSAFKNSPFCGHARISPLKQDKTKINNGSRFGRNKIFITVTLVIIIRARNFWLFFHYYDRNPNIDSFSKLIIRNNDCWLNPAQRSIKPGLDSEPLYYATRRYQWIKNSFGLKMQYKELLLIKNINMQKEFQAELIVII